MVIECPACKGKFSVPKVDDLTEIAGCQIGCPACGEHLFCEFPRNVVVYDDRKHTITGTLPEAD